MLKESIRLFNCIPVELFKDTPEYDVLHTTLPSGYVIDPRVKVSPEIIHAAQQTVGLSAGQMNSSFHKSWGKVKDAPIAQLVIEQMIHYLTTYGFQELGVFSNDTIFIPNETLDLPDLEDGIPLIFLSGVTTEELTIKVFELAGDNALSKETVRDLFVLVKCLGLKGSKVVRKVKNRELKALLYQHYGLAPTDPTEFLRYVIGKLTGSTLLIKNQSMVHSLESASPSDIDTLVSKAPDGMGTIFLRYKPLFLAMRRASRNKSVFNRWRRDAKRLHRPLNTNILKSLTGNIRHDPDRISGAAILMELDKASFAQAAKLAQALSFRATPGEHIDILYQVRNGSSWADELSISKKEAALHKEYLSMVKMRLAAILRPKVEGKRICIPEGLTYGLPHSEKQFMGNVPNGTSVEIGGDAIFGIHWTDTNRSIDLDLSAILEDGTKVGWDGSYRKDGVLFSGDMTAAPEPDGASELLYLRSADKLDQSLIFYVNFYNSRGDECPFTILAAQETADMFDRNYMVDPNNLVLRLPVNLDRKSKVLGIVSKTEHGARLCVCDTSVSSRISSSYGKNSTAARKHLVRCIELYPTFNDILKLAGGHIVRTKEECDIDLSIEALNKNTFFELTA